MRPRMRLSRNLRAGMKDSTRRLSQSDRGATQGHAPRSATRSDIATIGIHISLAEPARPSRISPPLDGKDSRTPVYPLE